MLIAAHRQAAQPRNNVSPSVAAGGGRVYRKLWRKCPPGSRRTAALERGPEDSINSERGLHAIGAARQLGYLADPGRSRIPQRGNKTPETGLPG
jgi:hypothetical protein